MNSNKSYLETSTRNFDPERLLPGERIHFKVNDIVTVLESNSNKWNLGVMFLTNYQIIFKFAPSAREIHAPLMAIESIKKKMIAPEYFELKIKFKDYRQLRFTIQGREIEKVYWYIASWLNIESTTQLFAFEFKFPVSKTLDGWRNYDCVTEYQRMGLPNNDWRITSINAEYLLCNTYPRMLAIPSKIKGQELMTASAFRSGGRIPVLVWKDPHRQVTLSRCSQPLTGLTGNRCAEDEKLLSLILQSSGSSHLHIIDARPKKNAVANQMKGGGYENTVYYENCIVSWSAIPNIHVMYDSWHKLHQLLNRKQGDQYHWYSGLEATGWMSHIHTIMEAAVNIVELVEQDNSVIVHCSDGWDRTPTILSLAELCVDPYYRTLQGFIVLIEKDWLSFGHRYGERSGHQPYPHKRPNQSPSSTSSANASARVSNFSPIFMLFIDCVYQLVHQFPLHFEFNTHFLKTLLDAVYCCQYGTFLCNSEKEREDPMLLLRKKTVSFWTIVNSNRQPFINPLYQYHKDQQAKTDLMLNVPPVREILKPSTAIRDFDFWREFYMRGWPSKSDNENKMPTINTSTNLSAIPVPTPLSCSIQSNRKSLLSTSLTLLQTRDHKLSEFEIKMSQIIQDQQSQIENLLKIQFQLEEERKRLLEMSLSDRKEGEDVYRGDNREDNQDLETMSAGGKRDTNVDSHDNHEITGIPLQHNSDTLLIQSQSQQSDYPSHAHSYDHRKDNHHDPHSQTNGKTSHPTGVNKLIEEVSSMGGRRRAVSFDDKKSPLAKSGWISNSDENSTTFHENSNGKPEGIIRKNRSDNHLHISDLTIGDREDYRDDDSEDNDDDAHMFRDARHAMHKGHNSSNLPIPGKSVNTRIRKHIRDMEHSGSFKLSKPPEWIPDEIATCCKHCSNEFSSFRRKHHCRNCGCVFCYNCCSQKRPIQRLGFIKPVRVCDNCAGSIDNLMSSPTSPQNSRYSHLVFT